MNRYPAHLVQQARRLVVSKGLSYADVARELRVDSRLISIWCYGLAGSRWASIIEKNQKIRKLHFDSEKSVVGKIPINKRSAKLFSAILYGCKGSKYPSTTHLALANSEPALITTFVGLLRKAFYLDESKWRVHLQIHNDQNYDKLLEYWSRIISIPSDRFYKPTITSPRGKKHRNEYKGTCTVKYYDFRIQLKLIGIFEEFMRKLICKEGIPNGSGVGLLNRDA